MNDNIDHSHPEVAQYLKDVQSARESRAAEPHTFLSRVYTCKFKFEQQTGLEPTQLFLGPREREELSRYVMQLEANGWMVIMRGGSIVAPIELAGMKIIGLASDGMRAGISVT